MAKLVKLHLAGDLGDWMKDRDWELNIKSVQEAISALNLLTENRFNDYFFKNNKLQAKYRVLINGRDFTSPVDEINDKNAELINQSELVMKKEDLRTIDIVPFIENSDSKTLGIILGVVLIIVGIILIATGVGTGIGLALILAGLALTATALLMRPPQLERFRPIDKDGNESYLFGGPVNIIGEGGPVPVGYGRLLVGSQVISSAYKIEDYQTARR